MDLSCLVHPASESLIGREGHAFPIGSHAISTKKQRDFRPSYVYEFPSRLQFLSLNRCHECRVVTRASPALDQTPGP
jgi:hypothetical protein